MNKLGLSLIAAALVLNLIVASLGGLHGTESVDTDTMIDVSTEVEYQESNITGVTVPPLHIYDVAQYDNRIYASSFNENKSSGEWHLIEIIALGQTSERIGAVTNVQDGFFQSHSCIAKESITTGTIELVYTNSSDGHLSLGGSIDMDRTEYWDVQSMRPIAIANGGGITISGLGALIGEGLEDFGDLSFAGNVRSWPDLTRDYVLSLEDQIFGSGQELDIGDTGSIYQTNEDNGYNMPYDWEIEQGLVIGGQETVLVNVSSKFWDLLPYSKQIWISNDMSLPARVWDMINISWGYEGSTFEDEEEDEEEQSDDAGYIIIEQERTLKKDGWSPGEEEVPWEGDLGDQTPEGYFLDMSPHGEFKSWYDNIMPVGGQNYDSGSYNFKPEELIEVTLDQSSGFQDFVDTYDDVTISRGSTNATFTDRDEIEGEFWWDVSFMHKASESEAEAAWESYENSGYEDFDAPWIYWMQVKKTVEDTGTRLEPNYTTTYEIVNESIRDAWTPDSKNKYQYPEEVLTLASFENILRLDSETEDRCFEDGELMWNKDPALRQEDDDYTATSLEVSGEDGGDEFMDMITMITGLSLPAYDFSWSHTRGWTGNDGYSYTANVNAENGQLLGTLQVEGTQFMALFS